MAIEVNQIEPNPRVLNSQGSAPVTGPGKGSEIYPKNVSGVEEAHYTDDQGREIQLTNNGAPNSAAANTYEFTFVLPANGSMAARIAAATGVPVGWTLQPGDVAAETQFGASATTLVVTHAIAGGKIAQEITVFESTTSGPALSQGFAKVDLTTPNVQKTNTAKTKFAVLDLQSLTSATKNLTVFVKLI